MKKGILYVSLCYALWGILPIFWKMWGSVNAFYILSCRVIWSLVFCALVLLFTGKLGELRAVFHDRKECLYLCGCGIMVTLNWGSFIYAVSIGHVLDSSLAYYINPIISILFAAVLFHEKIRPAQWWAVALAFIGILIPIIVAGQMPWLALFIAVTFAIYGAMKKRVHVGSEVSIFMETLFVTPFALAFVLYSEYTGTGAVGIFHGWQWLLVPTAGVVTSIPLAFFSRGVKVTPFSLTGILMYINPTLQLIVGVLFCGEHFTFTNAITFVFVWAALILFVSGNLKQLRTGVLKN